MIWEYKLFLMLFIDSSESEAGESSDDDADKKKGIETDSEVPTLAELQGNPSQIATSISLVDLATEARDGPEGMATHLVIP